MLRQYSAYLISCRPTLSSPPLSLQVTQSSGTGRYLAGFSAYLSSIGYVRGHSDATTSLNRMQFCVGRPRDTERLAITRKTDVEHIQTLRRWHDDAAEPESLNRLLHSAGNVGSPASWNLSLAAESVGRVFGSKDHNVAINNSIPAISKDFCVE